ncbi:MAG: MBL fold metallo-hydrolase [Armatimonadota bacterium]
MMDSDARMMVTLVMDNLEGGGLVSEHGLSFLIETAHGDVLFDAGASDAFLDNMQKLHKQPIRVKAVALSHGHYDHTGGLARLMELDPDVKLYAHGDVLKPRYHAYEHETKPNGMSDSSLRAASDMVRCMGSHLILPGVWLSGEIEQIPEYTVPANPVFQIEDHGFKTDQFDDERCMVLQQDGRTTVLLGCSHRGVENNILTAMELAGTKKLDRVVGGMHLGGAGNDRLNRLVRFLETQQISEVVCCHCTGQHAADYLINKLGPRVVQGHNGMSWKV